MRRCARFLLLGLFAAHAARAEVVFDKTLGPGGAAPSGVIGSTAVDYLIEPGQGALRGSNLFFSFSRFSIEPQKIAAFNGPAGVENVLARVTGSEISRIDGTLGSAIAGADVWLLNPNGVVFGAGARLALGGALYVSTGSYVRHADGTRFAVTDAAGSALSVARPEAFGFLGSSPGAIDVDVTGTTLRGRAAERLALVGGDVRIHAGLDGQAGFLWAQNGRIDLAAVASDGSAPAEVALFSASEPALDVSGPWQGRAITVSQNAVVASTGFNPGAILGSFAQGSGDISILGGSLLVDDAEINGITGGNEDGGDIDVRLSGDLVLQARDERATGLFAGTGVAFGNAQLAGLGDGGRIRVAARNIALLDGARMSTSSIWLGDAGQISLSALDTVRISGATASGEPSGLFSRTTVSGAGGQIAIAAERLEMDDFGVIVTETRGLGAGGSIDVDVDTLSLRGNARIDSSTRSATDPPAAGGTIDIRARREVTIAGRESDDVFSGITAIAQGATDTLPASTARAGDITISTPRLGLADGGTISTQALGSGDGGSITVWTGQLEMNGGILSASALEGQGGDVSIHANQRVLLRGGSVITAKASGAGDAGRIDVDAGRELSLDHSEITTESAQSDGGEVNVRARELVRLSKSEISTSVGGGTGGSITIDPDHVVLNQSQIVARAGAGTGGSIRIVAGQFVADVDSAVDASSQTGIDGTVQIVSPDVDLTGTLEALPENYADASGLLRQACAAARREGGGSFVVATSPRAPTSPDAPLGEAGTPAPESDCR